MAGLSHSEEGPQPAFATSEATGLDCEMAALLRASLTPFFEKAQSWAGLSEDLKAHGYGLAIRDGRLVLVVLTCGKRICTVRYLGTGLRELSERLGRPSIRASRDRPAAGEFLIPVDGSS